MSIGKVLGIIVIFEGGKGLGSWLMGQVVD